MITDFSFSVNLPMPVTLRRDRAHVTAITHHGALRDFPHRPGSTQSDRLRHAGSSGERQPVYVGGDRRQDPNLQAAAIDLRNRFRDLQRRDVEDAGSDQSRDVAAALARLWPQREPGKPDSIRPKPHRLRGVGK